MKTSLAPLLQEPISGEPQQQQHPGSQQQQPLRRDEAGVPGTVVHLGAEAAEQRKSYCRDLETDQLGRSGEEDGETSRKRRKVTGLLSEADIVRFPLRVLDQYLQDAGLTNSAYSEYYRYLRLLWRAYDGRERLAADVCDMGCGQLKLFRQVSAARSCCCGTQVQDPTIIHVTLRLMSVDCGYVARRCG